MMYTVNVKRLQCRLRRIQQRLRVDLTPEQSTAEPLPDRFRDENGMPMLGYCMCGRPFATRSGARAHVPHCRRPHRAR